jgi:hypothetical protein
MMSNWSRVALRSGSPIWLCEWLMLITWLKLFWVVNFRVGSLFVRLNLDREKTKRRGCFPPSRLSPLSRPAMGLFDGLKLSSRRRGRRRLLRATTTTLRFFPARSICERDAINTKGIC